MTKREGLKQRLKAADRRRQRRHVAAPPASKAPSSDASTPVDVAGLIVETILNHASGPGNEARDVMVIAALKSALRATTPSGDEAKRLAQRLNAIPTKPGVSMRAFRTAIEQMLSIANANHDPRSGDAFLRYLAMLSE